MPESPSSYFLDRFEQKDKSLVANIFLRGIRGFLGIQGSSEPESILRIVKTDATERIAAAIRRQHYQPERSDEQITLMNLILDGIRNDKDCALEYVQHCLEWEAKPREEREQIKQARTEGYAKRTMMSKPPSDRQISYITALGYTGPPPKNSAEASDLIESLKRG